MVMPTFETIMKPLLQSIEDGQTYPMIKLEKKLADDLGLTENEKTQQKPSGGETLFKNRLHWARIYLRKAGLVTNPKRAHVKITQEGKNVLKLDPPKIDTKYLMKYSDFKKFYLKKSSKQYKTLFNSVSKNAKTNLLQFETAYIHDIQKQLAQQNVNVKSTLRNALEKIDKRIETNTENLKLEAKNELEKLKQKVSEREKLLAQHKKEIERLKNELQLHKNTVDQISKIDHSSLQKLRNSYEHSLLDQKNIENWIMSKTEQELKKQLEIKFKPMSKKRKEELVTSLAHLSSSAITKDLPFLLSTLVAVSGLVSMLDKDKKIALNNLASTHYR